MQNIKNVFVTLVQDEEGQGMVEYSLILALVSVVAIGTLTTLGTQIKSILGTAANALTSSASGGSASTGG